MSIGTGIFLAALVWAIVTVFLARKRENIGEKGKETSQIFGSYMLRPLRVIKIILKFSTAIAALIAAVAAWPFISKILIQRTGTLPTVSSFDWIYLASGVLYVFTVFGATMVFALALDDDNPVGEGLDAVLRILNKNHSAHAWRKKSDGESLTAIVLLKQILLWGTIIFLIETTSKSARFIADFTSAFWSNHLHPAYIEHQGMVNAIFFIGLIVYSIYRVMRS